MTIGAYLPCDRILSKKSRKNYFIEKNNVEIPQEKYPLAVPFPNLALKLGRSAKELLECNIKYQSFARLLSI